MIPHKTAEEWSVGTNSFLAGTRPGLTVQNCPPQPPTDYCFFWGSDSLSGPETIATFGTFFDPDMWILWRHKIGDVSINRTYKGETLGGSNLGFGEYPDLLGTKESPGPFRPAAFSLDSVAIGNATRVIVYSGKNFTGKIIADLHGPQVLVNGYTSRRISKEFEDSIFNDDWSYAGPLFDQFPPSTRRYIGEVGGPDPGSGAPLFDWANGSAKVICD
ncbi:hypothetical protein [Ruixingdingia sedimenti]|uniref:Uncharacterized protein n=1 Tax=Ruixingdingia sedimenti TaxID=3073604 RepID=A0ABU1FEK8_9RHOB|nr:hypothetical protein [Xinfangfangia sp. LG-4]MDR5655336.1 hypothetical protein [Xinfangfangia sp. LG-4]